MNVIVRAQLRDVGAIWLLRSERAAWLAEKGSDQWSEAGLDQSQFMDRVRSSIEVGETWVCLDDDGAVLGTIALDQWADPGLWGPQEQAESLIVHRMITTRDAAGRGIGSALLSHAERVAATRNLQWLRLDAWTNNQELHRYYRGQGFRHVRTNTEHTPSGALFERPVRAHRMETVLISPNVHLLPEWKVGDEAPFVMPGVTYTLQHGPTGWKWDGKPVTRTGTESSTLDPNVQYRVVYHDFNQVPRHHFDNRLAKYAGTAGAVIAEPEDDTPIGADVGKEEVRG